jgi:hypothetical protein
MKTGPPGLPFSKTTLKNPYFCIFLQETGNSCPRRRSLSPSIAPKFLNPNTLTFANIP